MTTLHLSINGTRRVTAAEVRFPSVGVWVAEVVLDTAEPLAGRVTLALGSLKLSGTVDPSPLDAFVEARRVTIIGGGGGWATELAAKGYHNDAGVKRSTVLQDAAREAGETIVLGTGVEARLPADYSRHRGAASQVFEHVAPGLPWWVDAAGVTQVATARPTTEIAKGADLEVLDVQSSVVLAGDPGAIGVGSILRDSRLEGPFEVRELVVQATPEEVRMVAHDRGGRGGRLAQAVRDLVEGILAEKLQGLYRYRVVSMIGDRAQLQALTKGRHPNILPASLACGIAGGWAELAGGAEVLVGFEDGSPLRPLIVGYTPKGRPGHVPTVAALDGDAVELGDAEAFVHRIGDKSAGPVVTAAGSIITVNNPDGSTVILTDASNVSQWAVTGTAAPPGQLLAVAAEGSGKVKA